MTEDYDLNTQPEDLPGKRRGKARERIRRRKERQHLANQISGTRISKHLAPADSFRLPVIDPRILRGIGLIVAAVMFVIVLILGVGLFKNDPIEQEPQCLLFGIGLVIYTARR